MVAHSNWGRTIHLDCGCVADRNPWIRSPNGWRCRVSFPTRSITRRAKNTAMPMGWVVWDVAWIASSAAILKKTWQLSLGKGCSGWTDSDREVSLFSLNGMHTITMAQRGGKHAASRIYRLVETQANWKSGKYNLTNEELKVLLQQLSLMQVQN